MREDANVLDEIVVLGYGNIRRSDVTGSIASVSSESISKVASASVADALAGKMAGVQITTADGALDAEISVRVRGGGSITQDNSPLFLVDGFPVDDLSGIPPTDIESIDVLKEASMTAIYGARGANGVVIVTTKNPKMGKTTPHASGMRSFRHIAAKHPAAPPPIMAIFVVIMGLCLIFLLSYIQIFLCLRVLPAVSWHS